jgi:hypothetical protein
MKQGMDAGSFLKQNGAQFACVMSKVAPLFAQFSPALLCAVAAISSGGALGAPGIPAAVLGKEAVKQVLVDYPIGRLLDKLIGKKSSTLTSDEARQLQAAIESLTEKISQASRQNLAIDSGVAQFATALISGDELRQARQCIDGLDSKLGAVSTELVTGLDHIQEELAVMNKAALPTIEAVLDKEASRAPEFFRSSGPAWVDFQGGFVCERPEVADIIARLKQEDIVAVKGAPASGKSSVLRNVGYRLAAEGADVRFLGLRTLPVNQVSEISKIRHGFILVDDAHLNLGFVESLLLNRPNAKIILACRDINLRRSFGPTTDYKLAEYLDKATTIKAADAAEQILQRFEEKRRAIPLELRSALTRNDLWMMAWQLKSIESHGSIEEESVLTTVKEYVESIQACARPENILLPASAFFEYETAVRKPFLDSLSVEGAVKALEAQGEVVVIVSGTRDYVALHHSEVAAVYQRAFRHFDDFGADVKRMIAQRFEDAFGKQDSAAFTLTAKLLCIYLREYPTEITNLVDILMEDKMLAAEVIRNSLGDMSDGLEQAETASRIGLCIDAIAMADPLAAKTIVQRLSIEGLLEKVGKERSVYATAVSVLSLLFGDKLVAGRFARRLNIDDLVEEIDKEESIQIASWCISLVADASRDVAKRVTGRLDITSLVRKLDAESNVVLVGEFVDRLSESHRGTAAKVLGGLNAKSLVEKTKNAENVDAVANGIHTLAAAGKRARRMILNALEPDVLAEKLRKELNVGAIGQCLSSVAEIDADMSGTMLKTLDLDGLKRRLEREESAYNIARCLAGMCKANPIVAAETAQALDLGRLVGKIRTEHDVGRLRSTLKSIAEANHLIAERVVKELDIVGLVQALELEEDSGKFGALLYDLAMLAHGIAVEAVRQLDTDGLVERVSQEEDVGFIGTVIFTLSLVNEVVARRVVGACGIGRLVEKIDKAEDVRAIGKCITGIFVTHPPTARRVLEKLNVGILAKKVSEENDIESIGILMMSTTRESAIFSKTLDTMDAGKRREVLGYIHAQGGIFQDWGAGHRSLRQKDGRQG